MNQAKWAASDYRKGLPTAHEVTLSAEDETVSDESDREPLGDQESQALERAFARLKDTQQLLVRARFLAELRHGEIARDVLDGKQSEANVRVYVNRAMVALRRYYDEELKDLHGKEVPSDG
jgi:DNA-directed RNA polymerase specialized sigma24 family protein